MSEEEINKELKNMLESIFKKKNIKSIKSINVMNTTIYFTISENEYIAEKLITGVDLIGVVKKHISQFKINVNWIE